MDKEYWIFSIYFQVTLLNSYIGENIEKSWERLNSKRYSWGFPISAASTPHIQITHRPFNLKLAYKY